MKFYKITGANFSHHRTAGYVAFVFDPLEDRWLPFDKDDGRETRRFVSAEQAAEYLDAARAAWPDVQNLQIDEENHDSDDEEPDDADETARRAVEIILSADPLPDVVELGFCVDDHEARQLGFPTAEAHRRMLDRVGAALQGKVAVKLVPRASTVGTAAAAEAHDK